MFKGYSLSLSLSLSLCVCVCVCVRARACASVCVCVLAVYNKAHVQRISNREFQLWTFLQGTLFVCELTSVYVYTGVR